MGHICISHGQDNHVIESLSFSWPYASLTLALIWMIWFLLRFVHLKNHIRLIHTIKDMPPSAISNDRAHKWRNIPWLLRHLCRTQLPHTNMPWYFGMSGMQSSTNKMENKYATSPYTPLTCANIVHTTIFHIGALLGHSTFWCWTPWGRHQNLTGWDMCLHGYTSQQWGDIQNQWAQS